jgi:choline dehydrogenase-like flavoprotein
MWPASLKRREWDAIVIGTGMGGATLGYALAKAGKRVLFCEKGMSRLDSAQGLRGAFAENFFPHAERCQLKHQAILSRAGRYSEEFVDISQRRSRRFIPFIGAGIGGSSALFGMILERAFPADFAPRRYYPHATESTLPDAWPITYADMLPYYEAAERLFRVRGTGDASRGEDFSHLLPLPALSFAGQRLSQFLAAKGLHPYQLPMACEYVPDCESCLGFLCRRDCKNDSVRICLTPAVRQYGADLLDECEVTRLEAARSEVTSIECRYRGQTLTLRAPIVVVAAGALETPRLLFRSASRLWPEGLANDSGLVGRNLMRHYTDFYIPKRRAGLALTDREVGFNDLYLCDGNKFGTVQQFSVPTTPALVGDLEEQLRHHLPWAQRLFTAASPVLAWFVRARFSGRHAFASIMEDLPYSDNRVFLPSTTLPDDQTRVAIEYRLKEEETRRIGMFRRRLREILPSSHFHLLKHAENNARLAHACGTCRFGSDPKSSVLDPNNRAHQVSNLYVVDSSFFPSSTGTNPSLTIAANALRIADHLLGIARRDEIQRKHRAPNSIATEHEAQP